MKSAAMVALLLVFGGASLVAQSRDTTLTVWASQTEMQGENAFDGGIETEFEDGYGLGLSANRFFGSRLSVEGSVFAMRSDASLVFAPGGVIDLGTLQLTALTLGGQFHILADSRFDPYVGAGGAYVVGEKLFSSDTVSAGLGRIELGNEIGYYLNAGIGVRITEGLGIVLDARYLPFETSSRSSVTSVEQDLEISPRIYSAGLRLRF